MEVSLFGPGLPSSLTEGVCAEGLLVLDAATLFAAPRGMSDEALLSWDLDILTLNSTELMQTAAAIFRQSHVLQTFGIGAETLAHFLAAIGTRYHANPYHNFNHGVHVLLSSWLLARDEIAASMKAEQAAEQAAAAASAACASPPCVAEPLSQLHVLALLVASVGHDVDHPGVNNAYLCATGSPLARRYNDQSVLENHHAATTFEVLDDAACDVLGTLTLSQRKEVRRLMIAAVLATDMAQHQAMVQELRTAAHERALMGRAAPPVPANFTLRHLCHAADLGNCAIAWHLSREWVERICEETVGQALLEHSAHLPTAAKATPYTEDELFKRQLGFLDDWVGPFFRAAGELYPSVGARLNALDKCREACKISNAKAARRWREVAQIFRRVLRSSPAVRGAILTALTDREVAPPPVPCKVLARPRATHNACHPFRHCVRR